LERVKTGRTLVDDDEHTGRPTSYTTPKIVARIQELVRQDRRRTIHDIEQEVGIGYGRCQRVLTKGLGMYRAAVKFVPRILKHCRPYPAVSSEILLTAVIPHPPYSPDLAPHVFFLFPKMKLKLKGRQFDTTEEIQAESRECLTLTEKDFHEAFQKRRRRWDRCLHAGGNYFEGDGGR
jgi:hypothetical protein